VRINRRYELKELIGRGGMGAVYVAYDRLHGQTVALKQVLTDHVSMLATGSTQAEVRQALTREFRTLSTLRHPHIVDVLDYGIDAEGQPFFTMELLNNARPVTEARRTPLEAIRMVVNILQALDYLHRHGVLHRDLKPANVLVTDATLQLVDFGVAMEMARARGTAGTLAYMAPEVLSIGRATTASDLYAVGVVLYELLMGKHPYPTHDLETLRTNILHAMPDLTMLDAVIDNLRVQAPPIPTPAAPGEEDFAGTDTQPDEETSSTIPLPVTAFENTSADDTSASQQIEAFAPAQGDTFDQVLTTIPDILTRLLSKDPGQRYWRANDVIRDLHIAIGEPLPPESMQIRASFLEAAAFVGREDEISRLYGALEQLQADGNGSAWLVAGESGVGKSRLLEEVRVEALTRDILTVYTENTTPMQPLGMWRDPLRLLALYADDISDIELSILAHLIPDITTLLERELPTVTPVTARLEQVVVNMPLQYKEPLLLVFDNIAPAQIPALNRLARHARGHGVMVLCSADTDTYPNLVHDVRMECLPLMRFDAEEVKKLTRMILGEGGLRADLQQLLIQEAEGNALFVVETLRALAESSGRLGNIAAMPLPPEITAGGIAAVLDQHIARVPAWARPLLEVSAVQQRELDFNLLQHSIKSGTYTLPKNTNLQDWLWAVGEAAIVRPVERRWMFSHDRIRKRIVDQLPPRRLQQHRDHLLDYARHRLAQAQQGRADIDTQMAFEQLLGRLLADEDPLAAAQHFHRAADLALGEHRYQLAYDLAVRAIDLGNEAATLTAAAGYRLSRQYERARDMMHRYLQSLPPETAAEPHFVAELARLDLYLWQPQRALDTLGDVHWLDVRPRALWMLGRLQDARDAIAAHDRHAAPQVKNVFQPQQYLRHIEAEIDVETGNAARAIRLLESRPDAEIPPDIRDEVAVLLARAYLNNGAYGTAQNHLETLLQRARTTGDNYLGAMAATLLARYHRQLGNGPDALNAARFATEQATETPDLAAVFYTAVHEQAWVLWMGMQGDRARSLLSAYPAKPDEPLRLGTLRLMTEYLSQDGVADDTLRSQFQALASRADTLRTRDRYQQSPGFHYVDGLLQALGVLIVDAPLDACVQAYRRATELPLMAGQLADAALKLGVLEAMTPQNSLAVPLQLLYEAGTRA
jgi:serine/threonine protein kinase/tetratricopeptide (TPR) repeat protein